MKVASSLRLWLELQVKSKRPSGAIVRVNISHMPRTQSTGTELASYDAPSKIDDEWIAATVTEIEKATVADACEHGVVFQTYCLGVFRERRPDHRCNRKLFRVRGDKDVEAEADDFDTDENEESDEALSDPKHILAEMSRRITSMERHEESLLRTVIDDKGASQKQQLRLIEQQGEQINKLLAERAQMVEASEEILTARMEREITIEKEKARALFLGEMAETVKQLAPSVLPQVVAKLTGAPIAALPAPQVDMMKRFKESLRPDQLSKLAEVFDQSQQIQLMEILSKVGETN